MEIQMAEMVNSVVQAVGQLVEEIKGLRTDIKKDFSALTTEVSALTTEMKGLRKEMKKDFSNLLCEMRTEFSDLKNKPALKTSMYVPCSCIQTFIR